MRVMMTIALAAALLSGCAGTQPTRFYLLTPMSSTSADDHAVVANRELRIGIGPVELPHYLDGPQIVLRSAQHSLELSEFHHWAEPLKDNVTRVLADNIAALLRTEQISVYPWDNRTPVDAQILVNVFRLDADLERQSVLIARWTLLDDGGDALAPITKSTIVRRVAKPEHESVASALSHALAGLSIEIARVVGTQFQTTRGPTNANPAEVARAAQPRLALDTELDL